MQQQKYPNFILRIAFILVMMVNFAALLTPILAPQAAGGFNVPPGEQEDTIASELAEDVGAQTQITGNLSIVSVIAMAFVTIGLVRRDVWAVNGAIIILGVDIILKVMNILAQLGLGNTIMDTWLAFVLIIVDFVLMFFFYQFKPLQTSEEQQKSAAQKAVSKK